VSADQIPGPSPATGSPDGGAIEVFRNRPFLLLWLSQLATQVGGNMVLFGLTIIVSDATGSSTAVSLLIISYLAPAVLFSAAAGVYVDRYDRRVILLVTNIARAGVYAATFFIAIQLVPPVAVLSLGVLALLTMNVAVSTLTVFFAPAEAAMIPSLVPRGQLLAANGIFVFTLNASFAIGFALLGPLVVNLASPEAVIVVVAVLYLLAAGFSFALPASPPVASTAVGEAREGAREAVGRTVAELREGLGYIRNHRSISWSLLYLAIGASLIGVLGVLGPDFAKDVLGLESKDFVVVVLPLGIGVVLGILLLNTYGRFLARRRIIEVGLLALGVLLGLLAVSGPIARFVTSASAGQDVVEFSAGTSLLVVVIAIGFLAGVAYAFLFVTSQTQLQEELPEEVRGRVFGVLNMLISVASFLPILIVGPISDLVGTTFVLIAIGIIVVALGIASVVLRGPLRLEEQGQREDLEASPPGAFDTAAVAASSEVHIASAEALSSARQRVANHAPATAVGDEPWADAADLDAGVPVEPLPDGPTPGEPGPASTSDRGD
jgi:MFS family permease